MRAILALFALALITACSSAPFNQFGTFLPPQHIAALQKTPACCHSYADFAFTPMQLSTKAQAKVTPSSPAFEFPTGKSFFAAFELPRQGAASLVVQSHPVNVEWNNATAHALVPGLLFLNASHQPLVLVNPALRSKAMPFAGTWGEAEVAVPPEARFVVVLDSNRTEGLDLRDGDQRSGYLHVRSGPTGLVVLEARGG